MIYFDNAATTQTLQSVVDAMLPFLRSNYFNPSAQYSAAQDAKRTLEQFRSYMAKTLGAKPSEVRFTSGGTESDNWALKGIALANQGKGKHVVVSAIEHHAVLNSAVWLERNGFSISYVRPNQGGIIEPEALRNAMRPDTVLASVMVANNEVGSIQPIKELASVAHSAGALFHTDAVQAYGHILLNVNDLGVDALSVSAHKLHGPKGVGMLYARKGMPIESFVHGGAQERGYRAGTENLAGIAGMVQACRLLFGEDGSSPAALQKNAAHCAELKRKMVNQLNSLIHDCRMNGSENSLPGILSVSFKDVSSEALLLLLDRDGLCASAGSACASGSLEPSHVLQSMGVAPEWARGTIRFSFSELNTEQEVSQAAQIIANAVAQVRGA
jgi:cysteine desulfurase